LFTAKEGNMQKWEYCAITGIQFHGLDGVHGERARYVKFTKQGPQMQRIDGAAKE
jgi:hypothetical protein